MEEENGMDTCTHASPYRGVDHIRADMPARTLGHKRLDAGELAQAHPIDPHRKAIP